MNFRCCTPSQRSTLLYGTVYQTHLRARARAGVIFFPLLTRLSIAFTPRPAPTRLGRRLAPTLTCVVSRVTRVTRHTASASRRPTRAGARRPERTASRATNRQTLPHCACQLGEGQAVSSLAFERRLSHSLQLCSRTTRLHACASAPRGSNCGPSHTVCLCSMCYRIYPRSQPAKRKPGSDLLQHGTAGAAAHASATRRVVP